MIKLIIKIREKLGKYRLVYYNIDYCLQGKVKIDPDNSLDPD